jgi:hypothetical protein
MQLLRVGHTHIPNRHTDFPELPMMEQPLTLLDAVPGNPVPVETIHHVSAK